MLEDLLEFERKLPRWLQPAYHGAVFILGLAEDWAGKLLFPLMLGMLLLVAGPLAGFKLFVGLLLVAMAASAVAATLHALFEPVQRAGPLGTWLQWTVSFFGFLLTVVALTPSGPFSLAEPTVYPVAGGVAALAGMLMVFLDDRRPGRPLPQQYAEVERRRRWITHTRLRRALVLGRAPETPVKQAG